MWQNVATRLFWLAIESIYLFFDDKTNGDYFRELWCRIY